LTLNFSVPILGVRYLTTNKKNMKLYVDTQTKNGYKVELIEWGAGLFPINKKYIKTFKDKESAREYIRIKNKELKNKQ